MMQTPDHPLTDSQSIAERVSVTAIRRISPEPLARPGLVAIPKELDEQGGQVPLLVHDDVIHALALKRADEVLQKE
jgi:hypothetical protein